LEDIIIIGFGFSIPFFFFVLHCNIPDFYRDILFASSILLGLVHLTFEIRQYLWNPKVYINDTWNIFGR